MRTLILDDDRLMLKLHRRVIETLAISDVIATSDVRSVLDEIKRTPGAYDLILLDLQMPEIDGVTVIRDLHKAQFSGSLILVSGEERRLLNSALTLAQSIGINVVGSLSKPISRAGLEALIGKVQPREKKYSVATNKKYEEQDLRQAIYNNELVAFYQPKVCLATAEILGAEALVRWQHPEDGLIFPDRFIAVAESTGLIDALTETVLAQATGQVEEWRKTRPRTRVAVNISMESLSDLKVPEQLHKLVTSGGMTPECVQLEVTESRLGNDRAATMDVLTRIGLMRFGLAIDDFGTGHSSLEKLRDLPFDQLKIDRSFVTGLTSKPANVGIVKAILDMAKRQDMHVVAEGIETAEEWQLLYSLGCDAGQGYYVAKPMPAEDFISWANDWDERKEDTLAQITRDIE